MARHHKWIVAAAGLAASVALACGGDDQAAEGSAATWDASASLDRSTQDTAEGNRAPRVASIEFSSDEIRPGGVLRATVRAQDPDRDALEYGYTWLANGVRLKGEGREIQVPASLGRGDRIELRVIASDGQANSEEFSSFVTVGNQPPRITNLQIHVVSEDDSDLGVWMADPEAEDPDGDDLSFRYEWWLNAARVVGSEKSLARDGWTKGDEVHLIVWASDDDEEGEPFESAPFAIGNSAPDIVSRPPAMDSSGRFVYRVEARDRDGDRGLRYSLVQGPKGMTIDPFGGEVRWTASYQDAGEHIVEIAVDDRQGGITHQTFYLSVVAGLAKR